MSKLSLKRSLRFSIVIFLGSLLVVTLYLDYRRDEGIRHYLDMTTAAQDIAWQAAINLHRNSVETYFTEYVMRGDILEILRAAQESATRDRARMELYRSLFAINEHLQSKGLRQLHFHLPDGESFLRFHKLDLYGDKLWDVREAIRIANTELRPVFGFETGRIVSGFRNVFPIITPEGQHLGSVELSMPFEAVRHEVARLLPEREFEMLLWREYVDSIIFDEQQLLYEPWVGHPELMVEDPYRQLPDAPPPLSEDAQRVAALLPDSAAAMKVLARGQSSAAAIKLDGRYHTVTFTAIYDTRQRQVGYLASYAPAPRLCSLTYNFFISLGFSTLVLLILSGALYSLMRSRAMLAHERRHLQVINDTLGEGLYVMDSSGVITNVNQRATELLGYTRDELQGAIAHDLFHCHNENGRIPLEKCPIFNTVHQGEEYDNREAFRHSSGTIFTARVSSRPVMHEGQVVGSVTSFADITEKLRTEQELRDNEERLRLTMEAVSIGLWDWNLLDDRVQWDDVCYEMLGYAPGAFPLRYEDWRRLIHPDDVDAATDQVLEQLECGRSFVIEFRYRKADGEWLWVQGRGNVVQWDANGGIVRVLGTHTNIQQRKEAELALAHSEMRQKTLMQSSPAVLYAMPPGNFTQFTYISENVHSVLGYRPADIISEPGWMAEVVHPDDIEGLLQKNSQWLRDGAVGHCCHEFRVKTIEHHSLWDGQWIWIEDIMSAVRDERGRIIELVGAFLDISDRVQFEQRLSKIAGHVPGMIFQYCQLPDGTSYFPYSSNGIWDIYGVGPEVVSRSAEPVFATLHPDDREYVAHTIRESAQHLSSWQCEYRVQHPSGRTLWVRGESTPQRGADGSTIWHGYISDITRRKEAERLLADREERYRSILAALAEGIVMQSASGEIISCNEAAQLLLGLSTEQMEGRRSTDPHWKAIREDGTPFPGEEHPAMHTLRTGEPQRNVIMGVHRPDGSLVWILINSEPLYAGGQEAPYAVVTSFVDITERKKYEAMLEGFNDALSQQVAKELNRALEQETRFHHLFNAIPDAVVAHGYEPDGLPGRFSEVNDNACTLFGYTREQFLTLTPMNLHCPEDRDGVLANATALHEQGRIEFECDLLTADGSVFAAEVTVHRQELSGRIMALTVIRDITEKKYLERERQLEQQTMIQQAKMAELGSMMGAIAHQWKQPLNNIALLLQFLPEMYEAGELNQENIDETVRDIMNLLGFMSNTIDDFRQFFKPSTEITAFDLCRCVGDVLELIKGQLSKDSITVQQESCSPVMVCGYHSEFKQVVLNVINNAREVMLEKHVQPAIIEISFEVTARNAILRIADHGGGIPQHLLPEKLFEPFVSTKGEQGTGIGLSLARRIMLRMHGSIEAGNTERGAVFTLMLPLCDQSSNHQGY